jgi:hypothetical protein
VQSHGRNLLSICSKHMLSSEVHGYPRFWCSSYDGWRGDERRERSSDPLLGPVPCEESRLELVPWCYRVMLFSLALRKIPKQNRTFVTGLLFHLNANIFMWKLAKSWTQAASNFWPYNRGYPQSVPWR